METQNLKKRHDELARELVRRGMNHRSPLEQPDIEEMGVVDSDDSYVELSRRCPKCRELIDEANQVEA